MIFLTCFCRTICFRTVVRNAMLFVVVLGGSAICLAENIAAGKSVTVSSTFRGPSSNATDGNPFTGWQSLASDPQWAIIDLGQILSFNKIRINWEPASRSTTYSIQVSDNMQDWKTVFATADASGVREEITFTTVSMQYIRIHSTARSDSYGMNIFEFEVFPSSQAEFDIPYFGKNSLSYLKPTNSSSVFKAFGDNWAVDGYWWTSWQSLASDPEWFSVDLGRTCEINQVRILWDGESRSTAFDVQISSDNQNWKNVYSTNSAIAASNPHKHHAFFTESDISPAQKGRYVRLYSRSRLDSYGPQVYEFMVYGTEVNVRTSPNMSGKMPGKARPLPDATP